MLAQHTGGFLPSTIPGRHRRKTGTHGHEALVMHTYGEQGSLQFTVLETLRKTDAAAQLDPRVTRSPGLMGLVVLPFLSVSSLCPLEARCLYFRLALSSTSSCFSFQSPGITGTRHHVPASRSWCAFAVSNGVAPATPWKLSCSHKEGSV